MDLYPILFAFSITIFSLSSTSTVASTLSATQQIQDGNTIVSDGKIYELGFFSPENSKNRYLGIWYNNISPITVVWVANRETPITDKSGVLKVNKEGNLLILNGSNQTIWSSNSTPSLIKNINPVAKLLDNGNLILRDEISTQENPIWQSFDYPSNTLLPGMKFGKDLVTGIERAITSWKSPDDPSKGLYKFYVDTNGYPQVFKTEGQVFQFRLAPWNGVGFRGQPIENENQIYSVEFVINDKEISYRYGLKSSVLQRVVVMPDGIQVQSNWINRTQQWVVYGTSVVDSCSLYGLCGSYGRCSLETYRPPCNCLDGFEPRIPEEWHAGDWSHGCQRKKPLDCSDNNEDGFQGISGIKFPDTRRAWYNLSMSLGECEMVCRRNCSCTAYANLDVRKGGSGCLLWFDELMDMRDYNDHQELYIRTSTSELAGNTSFYKNEVLISVGLSISLVLLLLTAVLYHRKKNKKRHQRSPGNGEHTLDKDKASEDHMENLDDQVPFFSLRKIAKATRNFSVDSKIGEGGFGLVYKGVLGDGQVVAVKRLSLTSEQGIEEFRNEVMCISKLQHRNLVKLLGYCIHGNEKILIYEYMHNKSLDSFLFDETRSSMLDWTKRFHIIQGIARGILYLHQDSRLQIIHRDLKASNILLDDEMNPKISDFGIARLFVGHDVMAMTMKVVGTYGYISPEYAVHGYFSTKSDVFSFGVLMLEVVSGKKNRGFSHEGHSDNLLEHAWRLYMEDKTIELMDASLRNLSVVCEILRSIHVGLLCVQHHAEDRPTMLSAVLMLSSECALPPPKEPGFFTQQSFC